MLQVFVLTIDNLYLKITPKKINIISYLIILYILILVSIIFSVKIKKTKKKHNFIFNYFAYSDFGVHNIFR